MLLFFSSAFHCSHSYTYSVSIWPRTFSSHILDFGPTLTSSCPFSVLFFLAMPLHLPIYPPEPLKEGQLVQLLGGCGGVRGATAPICLWRGRWPSTCSPAPTPPQGQASGCRRAQNPCTVSRCRALSSSSSSQGCSECNLHTRVHCYTSFLASSLFFSFFFSAGPEMRIVKSSAPPLFVSCVSQCLLTESSFPL